MALALKLLGAGFFLLGLRWRLAVGRLKHVDTSVIRLLAQSFSSRPKPGESVALGLARRMKGHSCIALPQSSW